MVAFFHFFMGYIQLKITGFAPERFMNLCNNHGIELWDVKPASDGYFCKIEAGDFLKCKEFLKKTRTRADIQKKYGLPFFLFHYRKRKLFFVGFVFCILMLLFMTKFLWAFELSGNTQLTEDVFFDFLEKENVSYGMPISKLDIPGLEKQIREEYPYITWVSAKIKGTKLVVDVKENEILSGETEQSGASNLTATVSGNLISIITRSGVPKFQEGEYVEKGAVLISGLIPIENDDLTIRNYDVVSADGDVVIESIRDYLDTEPFVYEKKVYASKNVKTVVLELADWKVELGKHSFTYPCEIVKNRHQLCLFGNLYLPFKAGTNSYRLYKTQMTRHSKDEIKILLEHRFELFCETLTQKGVQIMKKNVKIDYYEKQAELSGTIVVQSSETKSVPIDKIPELTSTLEEQLIE